MLGERPGHMSGLNFSFLRRRQVLGIPLVNEKKKGYETFLKITLFCISQLSVDEIDQIFFHSSRNEISNPDFQTACLYLFGKYANSRNRPRTDGK